MPYFNYNDSHIYYEIHGKGTPLLFLHGWNGSIDNFKTPLLRDLENNNTVIIFDLPGYGKSDKMDISFDSIYNLIESLLDSLDIHSLNIAGFCMGAVFALDYTIRNQTKIDKLFLIETYIHYPPIIYPLLFPFIDKHILHFFLFSPLGIYFTKRYLLLKDYSYSSHFFKMFQRSNTEVSLDYVKLMWKYSKIDHFKRMSSINKNVIIILGEKTGKVIKRTADKIKKKIDHCELHVLKDAGHFPIEENSYGLIDILRSRLD